MCKIVQVCAYIHRTFVAMFVEHPQFFPAISKLVKSNHAGYPPVIKHGNGNHPCIDDFRNKPPFMYLKLPCLIAKESPFLMVESC
jgi:hypothetical protein